jgi:CubicO group peptidase (beta-lactamase class C family)
MIGSVNATAFIATHFFPWDLTSMHNRRMTRSPKRLFRTLLPAIALAVLAHSSSAQAPSIRFQRVVQPYIDAQMFMGSVLVAENGKIIFSKSYGMADLEWSVQILLRLNPISHR